VKASRAGGPSADYTPRYFADHRDMLRTSTRLPFLLTT
jgi:hypothetical protein